MVTSIRDRKTSKSSEDKSHEVPIADAVGTLLEEARMILPGLQALFGFQLIAVFSETFRTLPDPTRAVHWVAILFTLLSMSLLMTPAALDRMTGSRHVSEEFVRTSTRLLCAAMIPLMISLSLEIYVITLHMFRQESLAFGTAGSAFAIFCSLWFVFPLIVARRRAEIARLRAEEV